MDFEKLLIKRGKYWDIKIHHSQNCIGKCLLWYKGGENDDLLEISEEERKEFWELSKKVKNALSKLFRPDKFNYLSAGMRTKHLHFHIIPRYKEKREFEGITFEDVDWGAFAVANREIPEELLFAIRDAIRKNLN
jgi:diadenosine tetraphosphate (Ap4A) HIT family hydrolase